MPSPLLQRRDAIQRSTRRDVSPVVIQCRAVELSPLSNQLEGILGRDVAHDLIAVEVEFALLRLMFGVEVPGLVLLVVHPDHDAEEDRDDGHTGQYSVVG